MNNSEKYTCLADSYNPVNPVSGAVGTLSDYRCAGYGGAAKNPAFVIALCSSSAWCLYNLLNTNGMSLPRFVRCPGGRILIYGIFAAVLKKEWSI